MELLDRYLQAVEKLLPLKRQNDIIAELRANLESQLEERESELGRPLVPAEAEAWLRQLGSPTQMASHYLPQQYLIGPAIFPMYWYVLRLASAWAVIIYAIVSAVAIVFQAPTRAAVVEAIVRIPGVLLMVAFWVTLIFAVLEFVAVHYPEKCPQIAGLYPTWEPAKLPRLEKKTAGGKKPKSLAHAVAEVVFGILFLGWLIAVPHYPAWMFGPGAMQFQASPYKLAPIWMTAYWCIVTLNIVQLLWRLVDLLRGAWQYPKLLQSSVVKLFALIPMALLLSVQDRAYVLLKHPAVDGVSHARALSGINTGIHTAMLLVTTVVALQFAWEIGQALWTSYRSREAARV